MGKALIIGAGGVASVCIHKCCQNSDVFTEICIGPQARVTKDVLCDYFISAGFPELCKKITLSDCPLRRF